jgi:glycine/D-amino acid oxidase-like deaminating enzyme
MDLVSGYPFWLIRDGLPFQYPKLTENKNCDCVIIGGGISGALTAYYLIEAGIECILVDKRSIGLGSTCASTSLLQYELDIPLHQLAKKIGWEKASRVFQVCGEAIDKLTVIMDRIGFKEYEKIPSLFFTTHRQDKKFMEKECEARRKAGFEVRMMTSEELATAYGLKAYAAIHSLQGATHNAYRFTHALLQYCIKKGLQVFDRTGIERIEYKNEKVLLETNEKHTITSSHLVNATGYEVVNFIKKGIVDFYTTYAIASEHEPEKKSYWKERTMMWNTDDPYLYMLLTADNRVIVGGRDEHARDKNSLQEILQKKAEGLEKDFKKILPGIPFKREFTWSGVFGKTKDSLPYIGSLKESPRTYYSLGFGGNGITFSQVGGEIIADLLRGKKNKDAALFSFDRS